MARSTESKTLKFWTVPSKGIMRHIPIYELPQDALFDGMNVIEMNGELVPRPGITVYNSTDLSGTPTGATMYYKVHNTPIIILGTTTKVYSFGSGAWTDRTNVGLTGSTENRTRFTTQVLGNTSPTSYVIITNGIDAPQKWDGTAGTTSTVAGSPPFWTDIATISDRIVGIKPPYNVSWGPVRQIDSWPALNYHQAAFTPDEVVAIRNLGVQGGVLYKQRSLWTISPTGNDSDARAYRFDMYGLYEGPANPSAVVEADGLHVRMTATGRIGVFDGTKHQWIGDGIWPFLRGQIDTYPVDTGIASAEEIHGVYDPMNRLVYFYYPTGIASPRQTGIVVITLPTIEQPAFGCFLGTTEIRGVYSAVTFTDTFNQYIPVVFADTFSGGGGSAGIKMYYMDDIGRVDIDQEIAGYWQTGLEKLPDSYRLEGIELYAERGQENVDGTQNHGNLNVQPVTSWLLGNNGVLGPTRPIDLNRTMDYSRDVIGFDQRARFAGLRFSFDSASSTRLKYRGVALLGQKVVL